MTGRGREHTIEVLQQELQTREAGVIDLIDLYMGIEPIYTEAASHSAVPYNCTTSDSTNFVYANPQTE